MPFISEINKQDKQAQPGNRNNPFIKPKISTQGRLPITSFNIGARREEKWGGGEESRGDEGMWGGGEERSGEGRREGEGQG